MAGYAGSGKDTAATALIADGYQRMAFADGVRELALAVDPWILPGVRLSAIVAQRGWDGAKALADVRTLLQNVGKGVRDIVGPDAWVEVMERVWFVALDRPDAVITDVRYPNEAAWIRRWGGMVIRIDRPGVGPVNGHESETLVDAIEEDASVVNDGTPEELQAKVTRIVADYWATPITGLPF